MFIMILIFFLFIIFKFCILSILSLAYKNVWVSSRSWWWTGKPGMLQSMVSQRVRHDWATELNWTVKENRSLNGSPEVKVSITDIFHISVGCFFHTLRHCYSSRNKGVEWLLCKESLTGEIKCVKPTLMHFHQLKHFGVKMDFFPLFPVSSINKA